MIFVCINIFIKMSYYDSIYISSDEYATHVQNE